MSKTRANPESNVALMTLSGLEVLVTLTTDTGKILAKLHQVTVMTRNNLTRSSHFTKYYKRSLVQIACA